MSLDKDKQTSASTTQERINNSNTAKQQAPDELQQPVAASTTTNRSPNGISNNNDFSRENGRNSFSTSAAYSHSKEANGVPYSSSIGHSKSLDLGRVPGQQSSVFTSSNNTNTTNISGASTTAAIQGAHKQSKFSWVKRLMNSNTKPLGSSTSSVSNGSNKKIGTTNNIKSTPNKHFQNSNQQPKQLVQRTSLKSYGQTNKAVLDPILPNATVTSVRHSINSESISGSRDATLSLNNDQSSYISAGVSTLDNASTKPILSLSPYTSEAEHSDGEDEKSLLHDSTMVNFPDVSGNHEYSTGGTRASVRTTATSGVINSPSTSQATVPYTSDHPTTSYHSNMSTNSDITTSDNDTSDMRYTYEPSSRSTALTSIDQGPAVGGGSIASTTVGGSSTNSYILFNPGSTSQSMHQPSVYSTNASLYGGGSIIGVNSLVGSIGQGSHIGIQGAGADSSSVVTIASSTRNVRRRSIEDNASTVAIPPASIFERITTTTNNGLRTTTTGPGADALSVRTGGARDSYISNE